MVNPGMAIFKRMQRLQRGTEELEPNTDPVPPWLRAGYDPEAQGAGEWVSPSGMRKTASAKEASGLYAPQEQSIEDILSQARQRADDEQRNVATEDEEWEKILQRRRETVYSTIGVNINGEEVEIPVWDEKMTRDEAEQFARDRLEMGLSPFASDMELEATQDAIHPPTPEEVRKRAMKQYDEPDPDETPEETARKRVMNEYDKGTDDVGPRGGLKRRLTEKELLNEEPWLRDIIRSIPWRDLRPGPQFSPRDIPIIPGSPAGQLMYDPELGGNYDELLLAQHGTSSVNPGLLLFRKQLKKPKL